MRALRSTAVLGLMLGVFAASASAAKYNAVKQFSASANPHGYWSYRVSGTLLGTPVANGCGAIGLEGWYNGGSVPNSASVFANKTKKPLACTTNNTVVVPAEYLALDPESLPSVEVRWTAKKAGTYAVTGNFRGVDKFETSHPVAILHNAVSVYSNTISAYEQTDPFSLMVTVAKGDTINFLDKTNPSEFRFLGTGLQAVIEKA